MERNKCNYILVTMHCHFEYFMEYLGHLERENFESNFISY